MASAQLAVRDGNRIKHAIDGKGYGDLVPDAAIVRHAIEHMDAGDYREARWCLAVLDVRIAERERKAGELTR
jgi:hypothetical protein